MIVPDSDGQRERLVASSPAAGPLSRRRALLLPTLLLSVAANRSTPASTRVPVALASSLRQLWPSLLHASGVDGLAATFGASRTLARQLLQGAPFELFLSADDRSIALVVDAGIAMPQTAIDYASGRLVLVVREHDDAPASVDELVRWLLAGDTHRIAIAHPDHAPYGQAAADVLDALARIDGLDWRAHPERIVRGENASQALQFFLSGAADAALLPASLTDILSKNDSTRSAAGLSVLAVAGALHAPLRHRAVALQSAGSTSLRLLRALRSASVQHALIEHGLGPPVA